MSVVVKVLRRGDDQRVHIADWVHNTKDIEGERRNGTYDGVTVKTREEGFGFVGVPGDRAARAAPVPPAARKSERAQDAAQVRGFCNNDMMRRHSMQDARQLPGVGGALQNSPS